MNLYEKELGASLLNDGTRAKRTERPYAGAIIEKVLSVAYETDKRLIRYSIDLLPDNSPLSARIKIAVPTGTPLEATLAKINLGFVGRSVEIAHGIYDGVVSTALAMKEAYDEDNFFSGISFTYQDLGKIHLFHSVMGDKSRYKGTIALGEAMDHPSLWTPFPYRYATERVSDGIAFRRSWLPDNRTWTLTVPEGMTPLNLGEQLKSDDWVRTRDLFPVRLDIGKEAS